MWRLELRDEAAPAAGETAQRRLVLTSGDEKLDCDFGMVFLAQTVNVLGWERTVVRNVTVHVRRARRTVYWDQGLDSFLPPIFLSGDECCLDWFYWTDGRVEFQFGFERVERIVRISPRFQLMTVPRNGEEEDILMLTVFTEETQVQLDVSVIADFIRYRRLHVAAYGEVSEGIRWKANTIGIPAQSPPEAVKIVQKDVPTADDLRGQVEVLRSIEGLFKTPHLHQRFFQKLTCVAEDDRNVYLCSPLYGQGTLLDCISRRRLSEVETRSIVRQLACALSVLHDASIVHQDISPENVALKIHGPHICDAGTVQDWVPVLIDFGQARRGADVDVRCLPTLRQQPCKRSFRCPEWAPWTRCFTGQHDGRKVDCWQLGVLALIMLTGCDPLALSLPRGVGAGDVLLEQQLGYWFLAVQRGLGQLEVPQASDGALQFAPLAHVVSPNALVVLHALLQINPAQRCDLKKLLEAPWFLDSS